MATKSAPARRVSFKNPPKDLGVNRKLPNGNVLMFFAGNRKEDVALVTIVLDSKTNVVWLNTRNKKTRKEFSAPVYTLLRRKSTSLFQLAQIAAATGYVYPKAQKAQKRPARRSRKAAK